MKNRQPFDECFLMAVATVGRLCPGGVCRGVRVILFYQIGELFQSVAVGKSRRSIAALMDIRPDYANLEQPDGSFEQVDPDEVEVGSVIVVEPGGAGAHRRRHPGRLLHPEHRRPHRRKPARDARAGDEIISGCVNISGLLRVRTTKEFGESTVSRILDLVENSSMKKARAENFITRFARVYTPAVCYSALALALLPPLVLLLLGRPAAFGDWGLPRPDLPGHQLPLRPGHLDPPQLFSGASAGPAPAASWSRALPIWKSWPAPASWSLTRPAP